MWTHDGDELKAVATIFLSIALTIAFLVAVATGLVKGGVWLWDWTLDFNQRQCQEIGQKMDVPYYWTYETACMIEINGQWMPLEAYRYRADED